MAPDYLFAGLAVGRLDAALAWYERLWGRPPDMIPVLGQALSPPRA